MCQHQLHAAYSATQLSGCKVRSGFGGPGQLPAAIAISASQTADMCVSLLEQALHLPILRFIEIQANAVSNWHPSFSAGFKVQLMFSSNAAAGIKFLMPRYSKRKPLNVCIFCISSVMCQLTAIFGALP